MPAHARNPRIPSAHAGPAHGHVPGSRGRLRPGILCLAIPFVFASPWLWSMDHEVRVGGQSGHDFIPDKLTISVGDTVTFRNVNGVHNVHAEDDSFRCSNDCRENGGLGNPSGSRWESTVTFNQPGTVDYRCDLHAIMRGSITVEPADEELPPTSVPITTGFTGSWYNAAQSGHGFNIEVLANGGLLAYWYVFDAAGNPAWIVAQGEIDGTLAILDAYLVAGGAFPPDFDPGAVTRTLWGTITFTFTDCNQGHAAWDTSEPGYADGEMDMVRLTLPAGLSCP